jgi:hypothetical protein
MRWLIGTHLVLAAAPAFEFLLIRDERYLLLIWVAITLPFGSAMTVSVWMGLGRARFVWRLLTTVIALAYVTLWLAVGNAMMMSSSIAQFVEIYLEALLPIGIVMVLFGGMFLLLGRIYQISRVEIPDVAWPAERFQFSVLHVLALMSLIAVILTLLHTVRENNPRNPTSVLGWTAEDSLAVIVFFLNAGCAAYATLWPSHVKRNVSLVLLVSTLTGIVIGFATRNDQSEWRLFVGSMLIGIIPTVVEIVSLLVVRSCGYRLVRRNSGTQVARD